MDLLTRIEEIYPDEIKMLVASFSTKLGRARPLQDVVAVNISFLDELLGEGLTLNELADVVGRAGLEALCGAAVKPKSLHSAMARARSAGAPPAAGMASGAGTACLAPVVRLPVQGDPPATTHRAAIEGGADANPEFKPPVSVGVGEADSDADLSGTAQRSAGGLSGHARADISGKVQTIAAATGPLPKVADPSGHERFAAAIGGKLQISEDHSRSLHTDPDTSRSVPTCVDESRRLQGTDENACLAQAGAEAGRDVRGEADPRAVSAIAGGASLTADPKTLDPEHAARADALTSGVWEAASPPKPESVNLPSFQRAATTATGTFPAPTRLARAVSLLTMEYDND